MKSDKCEHCCKHCGCSEQYCLKKVPIFSALSSEEMGKIANYITHKSYKKGDIIFNEGAVCDSLFVVNRGSLKVYTYTREGKEQILYLLTSGDFLGDMNLLKKEVFNFSAAALEDTYLCILSKEDFNKVMSEHPDISSKILEYSYNRIKSLESLVKTLTTKDIDARLASLLINLTKSFGVPTSEGIEISFYMGREDMANLLGVTRETVSRRLSYLQSENLIKVGSNKIVVVNLEALKDML